MSAAPIRVLPAAAFAVKTGGVPVTAIFGGVAGGFIQNPATAIDEGFGANDPVEVLFIDPSGAPAVLSETATCFALQPGAFWRVPRGQTTQISINAVTSGHRFSAVILQPPPQPPTPQPGPFPPASQPTVQGIVPSYVYVQYNDDQDVQAFVRSWNEIAQDDLDWFNDTPLPIYTDQAISGALLDWIGQGLYGITRPSLSSGVNRNLGPYNTAPYNSLAYNARKVIGPQDVTATTDDFYKRIITWNFSRIDGYYFDVPWLKRRIMRFLIGENGSQPPIPNTYQISVSFGVGNQINVTLLSASRNNAGAGPYNTFAYNAGAYNTNKVQSSSLTPLPNAAIFIEAAQSGVLQLPFEWDFVFSNS